MAGQQNGKAVKAGLWYVAGNVLVKGIAFLTLPIFARLMTTAQYGVYNTFAAYVSVLAAVVSLGLPSSVRNARYDLAGREDRYHGASAVMILLAFAAMAGTVVLFHESLSAWTKLSGWLLLVAVVNSTCTALHSYYNNILVMDYDSKSFLRLSFFYSLGSVACSAALILTLFPVESALGRAIGNMLPMAVIAGYVLVKLWGQAKPRLQREYVRYGLRFGLPLIPSDLSSIILNQFDRVMIYNSVGEAQAGLYSFAYNLAVVYQAVAAAIDGAWTPWMFQRLHQGERMVLRRQTGRYLCLLTNLTALGVLVSPELIWLLSGGRYGESRTVVVPILGAMYFYALGALPVGVEMYHKKTGWVSACTGLAAALNVALNLWFIPRYGWQAAAYTTLACYACYGLAHCLMAERLLGWRLFLRPVTLLSALGMAAVLGLAVWLLDAPLWRWGIALAGAMAGGVYGFRHRQELIALIRGSS